jgi:hypothetical protein
MTVVWRRGSVGLQGVVIGPAGPNELISVRTERGVFAEYAGNLMPLEAVLDPSQTGATERTTG